MTLRSLATTASLIVAFLASTALPGVSGEAPRDLNAPFAMAAAQGTAPNFSGISKSKLKFCSTTSSLPPVDLSSAVWGWMPCA